MVKELFSSNPGDFFKNLGKKITEITHWSGELRIELHSDTKTPYLGHFDFCDNGLHRFLNVLAIDESSIFVVNKYYNYWDWKELSEEERVAWKRDEGVFLPIDGLIFMCTNISEMDEKDILSFCRLEAFKNLDCKNDSKKDVYSYINEYFVFKQEQKNIENKVAELSKKLEVMKNETFVSKIVKPLAEHLKESSGSDSYSLSKQSCNQGMRINISFLKGKDKKRLSLLVVDEYPFEIIGVNEDNTFKTAQLPASFKDLAGHLK